MQRYTRFTRVPQERVVKQREKCEQTSYQANKSMHKAKHKSRLYKDGFMNSSTRMVCRGFFHPVWFPDIVCADKQGIVDKKSKWTPGWYTTFWDAHLGNHYGEQNTSLDYAANATVRRQPKLNSIGCEPYCQCSKKRSVFQKRWYKQFERRKQYPSRHVSCQLQATCSLFAYLSK